MDKIENDEIDKETKWALIVSIAAIVIGIVLAFTFSILKLPV